MKIILTNEEVGKIVQYVKHMIDPDNPGSLENDNPEMLEAIGYFIMTSLGIIDRDYKPKVFHSQKPLHRYYIDTMGSDIEEMATDIVKNIPLLNLTIVEAIKDISVCDELGTLIIDFY